MIYDHNDYSSNTTRESYDALFYKNIFSCKNHTKSIESNTYSLESNPKKDSNNEVTLRRNKRPRIEKDFGDDFLTLLVDPLTYSQAMTASDVHLWKQLIKNEIDFIL